MNMNMHTDICPSAHIYLQTCTHIHTDQYINACIHICKYRIHRHMYKHTHTDTDTDTDNSLF